MEKTASSKTVHRTVRQYSKGLISGEDMRKLLEIAGDYGKVKDYVYQRYGGPSALSKLYPGYTVQNEMTASGLRGELGLPSVYFYLAVFDALGDIKTQWTKTKAKLSQSISQNPNFTEEEKHYLRFLMKTAGAFEAVVNRQEIRLQKDMEKQYHYLAEQVEEKRLQNYLRRQVRKHQIKLHTNRADGFSVSERAYRYGEREGEQGINIAVKEKRKRMFIPLTDHNRYDCQLYVKLYPEESRLEICVPICVNIRQHQDYVYQVGVALGMNTMLTTDQGHEYGTLLGQYHREYVEWMREQVKSYSRNRENNPGRKKYTRKKERYEAGLHSYINHELNRFIREEKPEILYLPKLPAPKAQGASKAVNHSVTLWQRGYIRKRLMQKCKEQSVEIAEVFGKEIGSECSRCGEIGKKEKGIFICNACGLQIEDRLNAARNAKKRGMLKAGNS